MQDHVPDAALYLPASSSHDVALVPALLQLQLSQAANAASATLSSAT
jgi:hypothetical protein